jgi:hypothetical protein
MEIVDLVKPRRGRPCKTGTTVIVPRQKAPARVKRSKTPPRERALDPIGTVGPITFPVQPAKRVHVGFDERKKPVFVISPASATDAFVGTFEEFCRIREERHIPLTQYYIVTIKAISERIVSQFQKEPIEFVCYGDKNLIAYNKSRDVFVRRYLKGHGSSQFTIRYDGILKSVAEWFGSASPTAPSSEETKEEDGSALCHVARGRPSSTTTQTAPKEFPSSPPSTPRHKEDTTTIKFKTNDEGFLSQKALLSNVYSGGCAYEQQFRVVERKHRQKLSECKNGWAATAPIDTNPNQPQNDNGGITPPTEQICVKDGSLEARGEGVCELPTPIR